MQETLGIPFIPFTFPTRTVRNLILPSVPSVTDAQVDKIWDMYQNANLSGQIPAYNPGSGHGVGNAKIISFLYEMGISKMLAAAWLNATSDASGFWGYRWIDPLQSKEAVSSVGRELKEVVINAGDLVGKTVGGITNPVLSPVLGNIKWIGIGVAVLGAAYVAYEMGLFKKLTGGK